MITFDCVHSWEDEFKCDDVFTASDGGTFDDGKRYVESNQIWYRAVEQLSIIHMIHTIIMMMMMMIMIFL